MFKDVAQADPAQLAQLIGCPQAQVEAVLSGLAGMDDHDWLEYFVQRTPLAYEMGVYFLGELWLRGEPNSTSALTCIRELNEKLEIT